MHSDSRREDNGKHGPVRRGEGCDPSSEDSQLGREPPRVVKAPGAVGVDERHPKAGNEQRRPERQHPPKGAVVLGKAPARNRGEHAELEHKPQTVVRRSHDQRLSIAAHPPAPRR